MGAVGYGVGFESSRASSRIESLGLFALGIRWTSNQGAVDRVDVLAGAYLVSPVSVQTPVQMTMPTDTPTLTLINLPQPQGTAIRASGLALVLDEPLLPASTVTVRTVSQESQSSHPIQDVSALIHTPPESPAAVPSPTLTMALIPPQGWDWKKFMCRETPSGCSSGFWSRDCSRNIKGYVEAGPNAVLAFSREGYRKSDVDLPESWATMTYGGFWKRCLWMG